jgi:hypothetical protein
MPAIPNISNSNSRPEAFELLDEVHGMHFERFCVIYRQRDKSSDQAVVRISCSRSKERSQRNSYSCGVFAALLTRSICIQTSFSVVEKLRPGAVALNRC